MTTLLRTASVPSASKAAEAAWTDATALMENECARVTGASTTLRRGALLVAAVNLGNHTKVTLEAALSALLAAAQAGGLCLQPKGFRRSPSHSTSTRSPSHNPSRV